MRKLAYTLALLAANATVTDALALGLGPIKVNTNLNQPLDAEIKLLSIPKGDIDNIKVKLASESAFERAGLQRPYVLSTLNFEVEELAEQAALVRVTSHGPVKEPFLNFLVEVTWPSGRLLREYTVLLDPPIYRDKAEAAVIAAASQSSAGSPVPALPTRQAASVRAGSASAQQATSPSRTASGTSASQQYTTRSGDSLWQIAKRQAKNAPGIGVYQMMEGIYSNNPDAFVNGNIHRLKASQTLQIPASGQLTAMNEQQALAWYNDHRDNWQNYRYAAAESVRKTPVTTAQTDTRQSISGPKTGLTIASAPEQDTPSSAHSGMGEARPSTDAGSAQISALQNQLNDIAAENTRIQEENKHLRKELDATKALVSDLRNEINKLIMVQNDLFRKLEQATQQQTVSNAASAAPASLSTKQPKDTPQTLSVASLNQSTPEGIASEHDEEQSASANAPSETSPSSSMNASSSDPTDSQPLSDESSSASDAAESADAPPTSPAEDNSIATTENDNNLFDESSPQTSANDTQTTTPADNATTTAEAPATPQPERDASAAQPTQSASTSEPKGLVETYLEPVKSAIAPVSDAIQPVADAVPGGWWTLGGGLGALVLGGAFLMGRRKKVEPKEAPAELPALQESQTPNAGESLSAESEAQPEDEQSFDDLIKQADEMGMQDDEGLLEEADVYISYEQYEKAEELLKAALENAPNNQDYRLKLLEVYAANGDTKNFEREAAKLQTAENAQGERWETAQNLWQSMGTGGALLAGGAAALGAASLASAMSENEEDSSFSHDMDSDIATLLNDPLDDSAEADHDDLHDLDNADHDDLHDLDNIEDGLGELNGSDLGLDLDSLGQEDDDSLDMDLDAGESTQSAVSSDELGDLDMDLDLDTLDAMESAEAEPDAEDETHDLDLSSDLDLAMLSGMEESEQATASATSNDDVDGLDLGDDLDLSMLGGMEETEIATESAAGQAAIEPTHIEEDDFSELDLGTDLDLGTMEEEATDVLGTMEEETTDVAAIEPTHSEDDFSELDLGTDLDLGTMEETTSEAAIEPTHSEDDFSELDMGTDLDLGTEETTDVAAIEPTHSEDDFSELDLGTDLDLGTMEETTSEAAIEPTHSEDDFSELDLGTDLDLGTMEETTSEAAIEPTHSEDDFSELDLGTDLDLGTMEEEATDVATIEPTNDDFSELDR